MELVTELLLWFYGLDFLSILQWGSGFGMFVLVSLMTRRGRQFWVWVDQGLSIVIGSGWADETPSCYYHRQGGLMEVLVNKLFFWQKDQFGRRNHCHRAWLAEKQRRHMPPELRD